MSYRTAAKPPAPPRPTDADLVANLALCEHAHGAELRLDWCNVCGAISGDHGKTWTLPRVAAAAKRSACRCVVSPCPCACHRVP
jgi:hypothetical protein